MHRERPYRRERRRGVLTCLLLLVAYFVVPLQSDPNGLRLVLRVAGTAALVLIVAWLVTAQVRRQLAEPAAPGAMPVRAVTHLAVALVAGLLTFALADYLIALAAPGQFVGLATRVDALYFALATLTTVGYGDVHAHGQFARVVVSLQMVFSIGVLTTGLSIVVRELTRRPGGR